MKKLVTAALTAVTAVIAGSAIALTPDHAQEVPPGEDTATPQATATPQPTGTTTPEITQTATPQATQPTARSSQGTTTPQSTQAAQATATPASTRQASTPQAAQSTAPHRSTPEATAPGTQSTNFVVFVVPFGVSEISDAACSLDQVAESSRARSAMEFRSSRDHSDEIIRSGVDRNIERYEGDGVAGFSSGDIGLPSEACTTLQGLFASLAGLTSVPMTTDSGTDTFVDGEGDEANGETADFTTEHEETTEEEDGSSTETTASLTPVAGRTSVYVTIFAGGDAGEDGCTLGDLIAGAGGSVPVVEAGAEVPLQGVADISAIALPADACAALAAFLGAMVAPATSAQAGQTEPSTATDDDDDVTPDDDEEMTDGDAGAATSDDEDATSEDDEASTDEEDAPSEDDDATADEDAPTSGGGDDPTPAPSGTPRAGSGPDTSDDEDEEEDAP